VVALRCTQVVRERLHLPKDLLVGFANANNGPGWEPSARRLIDILIAGLQREAS
jgi:hypothetical protein